MVDDTIAFHGANVNALADLLRPKDDDTDDDDDIDPNPRPNPYAKLGPGDLGSSSKSSEAKKQPQKDPKDIWDPDEVPEAPEVDDIYDDRPQPEYEIVYKQKVTSEDIFLQMGNKTPATFSCEQMVVKIELPKTKSSDISLDVTNTFVDCRTPCFKLGLHLPHTVDGNSGKGQWNSKTEQLIVTVSIVRELDDLNF